MLTRTARRYVSCLGNLLTQPARLIRCSHKKTPHAAAVEGAATADVSTGSCLTTHTQSLPQTDHIALQQTSRGAAASKAQPAPSAGSAAPPAAPASAAGTPVRHYLPLTTAAVLLPHCSISISTHRTGAHVVVISCVPSPPPALLSAATSSAAGSSSSSSNSSTHQAAAHLTGGSAAGVIRRAPAAAAATAATAASAARRRALLPTWLFGFACGSAAATAAAVSYLGSPPAQHHHHQQQQLHTTSGAAAFSAAAGAGVGVRGSGASPGPLHSWWGQQPPVQAWQQQQQAQALGQPWAYRNSSDGNSSIGSVSDSSSSSGRSSSSSSSRGSDGVDDSDWRAALSAVLTRTSGNIPQHGSISSCSGCSSSSCSCRGNGSDGGTAQGSIHTGLKQAALDSARSSGSSSSSSSSGGVVSSILAFLLGLMPPGPAHAGEGVALQHQQQPGSLLPTPWEHLTSSSSSAAGGAGPAVMLRSSISEAAAAAAPAVVHLVASGGTAAAAGGVRGSAGSTVGDCGPCVGMRPQGSGFIYDPRGYILTNAHVVLGSSPPASPALDATAAAAAAAESDGASKLRSCVDAPRSWTWPFRWQQQLQQPPSNTSGDTRALLMQHTGGSNAGNTSGSSSSTSGSSGSSVSVHLHDGRVFEGRVLAVDVASDLAVLKVDVDEPLPAVVLGESHRLRVGEWVVALGSPFLLKQSATAGIISCVERRGSELGLTAPLSEFIQTDAAINAGSSGGPLVNLDGHVVAMNTMKAAPAAGASFAIPIDNIKSLLSEMSRYGRVRRPYAGITMAEVTPSRMAQLRTACPDFPASVVSGIVVTRVTPGSPAAAAGLLEDDVIVRVTQQPVALRQHTPAGVPPRADSASDGTAAAAAEASSQAQVVDGVGLDSGPVQQQHLGCSVAGLAAALKSAIGSSLELVVVREVRIAADCAAGTAASKGSSSSSSSPASRHSKSDGGLASRQRALQYGVDVQPPGSVDSVCDSDGGGRYAFVKVQLRPLEAEVGA